MVRRSQKRGILLAAFLLLLLVVSPAAAAVTGGVAAPAAQVMVPIRLLSEAIGGSVEWNGDTQSVNVQLKSFSFRVKIDGKVAMVRGRAVYLKQVPALVNDRTMVPLSLFVDQMGLSPMDVQTVRAAAFLFALTQGRGDQSGTPFSPALTAVMPAARIQAIGKAMAPWGTLAKLTVAKQTTNAVHNTVEMVAQFAKVPMLVDVRFTPTGQIDDYFMNPYQGATQPAGPPSYADPAKFTEQDVVVGQGQWATPGTLTLPVGDGPFAAVVLVQGSGPNDRNEEVGGVMPFRDLALGLASQKIAVLRYEKRTREHSQQVATAPQFGLQEETVLDALTAVQLLSTNSKIDPKRIFVLGHSLGGYAMPRIIDQDKQKLIAGGIIMAGPPDLLQTLVDQNKILAQAGLVPAAQVPFIEGQVAMLKDPTFDPAHPPASFVLGMPYYYADWRANGLDLAKSQTAPLLILQGERDCQVPVSQYQAWYDGLNTRLNVAFKLYPKLNHLFTEGEGAYGLPSEYHTPANVPLYVVNDIATWIGK